MVVGPEKNATSCTSCPRIRWDDSGSKQKLRRYSRGPRKSVLGLQVGSLVVHHEPEKQEVDRQTTGSQPVSEFAEVGMGEIVEGSSNLGM